MVFRCWMSQRKGWGMIMDYNILTEISKNKRNKRDSILSETKSVQLEKIQRMDEWMPRE